MIHKMLAFKGNLYAIGKRQGELLNEEIRHNIAAFFNKVQMHGGNMMDILKTALKSEKILSHERLEEITGISDGTGIEYPKVLSYNLYHDHAFLEGCTVMMAIGNASNNGRTIFFKQSDKVGSESYVGEKAYKNKEINIALILEPEGGHKIIGVGSAGSTALKMGMSDQGVACGCNISRTKELLRRQTEKDSVLIKALDRGALLREGLEKGKTANEAAQAILPSLITDPMSTPGNIEFADANEAVIIEGSYSELAMEKVQNDVAARSNRFVLLSALARDDDLSSICRYVRCRQLLEQNKGNLTMDMFKEFSMDHANGPGPNSICRHGTHFTEETSLSSAVMEIDPEDPTKSKIALALGKPCHSWKSAEAHVELDMTMGEEDIPAGLRNGEIWKKYYTEEPNL